MAWFQGKSEPTLSYVEGATVTLEVTPDAGSVFAGWQTADGRWLANIYYAQPGDTVYAVFEKK